MPPFSRKEKVLDYINQCEGVRWREERLKSLDDVEIVLLIGESGGEKANSESEQTVILYFQGNGGSLPPRLPSLSRVLRLLNSPAAESTSTPTLRPQNYTLIALSYRGYWKSSGRPSERGIKRDAIAAVNWICKQYSSKDDKTSKQLQPQIILWGQSLGASVAASTAVSIYKSHLRPNPPSEDPKSNIINIPPSSLTNDTKITGLILETPFPSIKAMLQTIYPQKYLPYRYLYPFLWNHWDMLADLASLSQSSSTTAPISLNSTTLTTNHESTIPSPPEILLLQASADELIPAQLTQDIVHHINGSSNDDTTPKPNPNPIISPSTSLSLSQKTISPNTLHNEILSKAQGRKTIAEFIRRISSPV